MKRRITAAEFLQAYSNDLIDSREAMDGVGVDSFRDLLNAMVGCGFRLPRGRGREEQVEREVAEALPMLAETLGVPLPRVAPK